MNSVNLIGRLTRDPDLRYTDSQLAVARFAIAIDRGKDQNGSDKGADFPNIVVFGKSAENCEKYLSKGKLVAIQGRIQTGSYTNKEGNKVYTTDVVANNVQFLEWGSKDSSQQKSQDSFDNLPDGVSMLEDDFDDEIPF